jgi:hypothetical protein
MGRINPLIPPAKNRKPEPDNSAKSGKRFLFMRLPANHQKDDVE